MHGEETIRKMNRVPRGTEVEVSAHCVEFVCPRCGGYQVGEGYVKHRKNGQALVQCLDCGRAFPAKLMPL